MTDALNPTVPAGWYPDPWGTTSQRWWDGSSWSSNLDPQPGTQPGGQADAPVPARESSTAAAGDVVPLAARSTVEPASSYRDAPAPTPTTHYPSRRALRALATTTRDEPAAATEDLPPETPQGTPVVDAMPAFTQPPEFSPEPVPALPPPVWRDPAPEAEPVELPAAEPVIEAPPAPGPSASEPGLATAEAVPAAEPAAATPAAAPAEGDDGWAASLARWDDEETTSAPPDALPIFGDSPPVSYSQRTVKYRPLHGRTSPVWLIVFMPVAKGLSIFGSLYLFPGLLELAAALVAQTPTEAEAMGLLLVLRDWLLFALLPLSIAFFVFTLILGFQDRARLRLLGHDQTASPWWIVLGSLVYLIVRSIRVRQCTGRRGSGPLTTYVCLYIAPPIALIIARAVTSALYGAIPA